MNPLEIRRIRVRNGALDLEVAVAMDVLHVTERQAERILDLLPNLARHVCVNGREDGTFGTELVGTELAHLLEHVIIELQGQAVKCEICPGKISHFTGHTSWLEELDVTAPQGYALMRTTVTFSSDFAALQAMRDACAIIEWAVDPAFFPEPRIRSMVEGIALLM